MSELPGGFIGFLVAAKRATYAAPDGLLPDRVQGPGILGQEAVCFQGVPVWGMNYYGRSIAEADSGPEPGSEAVGMGDILLLLERRTLGLLGRGGDPALPRREPVLTAGRDAGRIIA